MFEQTNCEYNSLKEVWNKRRKNCLLKFSILHTIGSIYKSIKKISSNDLLMTLFSNQSNGYFYVQILTLF